MAGHTKSYHRQERRKKALERLTIRIAHWHDSHSDRPHKIEPGQLERINNEIKTLERRIMTGKR
jgi:hypothetical protein